MKKNEYTSVEKWLNRLSDGVASNYDLIFQNFLKWLPDACVEKRKTLMTQMNKAFDKEEYEELEVRTKALLVFAESNPEDLIRYQKRATGDRRYLILDLIQQYISEKQAISRTGYLNTLHSSLRSFFLHNRCELPRDSSFKIRGKKSPVTGALNVEIIKDILRHCNAVRARIIENMLHVVLCNYKIIYSMVP